MLSLFIIGGVVTALVALRNKHKGQDSEEGVGAVKVLKAIGLAQEYGIPLGVSFDSLSSNSCNRLERIGERCGYKQTKKSKMSGVSYAEAVYKYICNKYRQLGIMGVGELVTYPHTEYRIKNDRGDLVVIYQDYDEDEDFLRAVDTFVLDTDPDGVIPSDPESQGYYETLLYIANGGKFVWKSKRTHDGGRKLKLGLKEALFGDRKAEKERRVRIKMLASEEKGGVYVSQYLHNRTAHVSYAAQDGGDYEKMFEQGAYEALLTVTNSKEARDIILSNYYKWLEGTPENQMELYARGMQEDEDMLREELYKESDEFWGAKEQQAAQDNHNRRDDPEEQEWY